MSHKLQTDLEILLAWIEGEIVRIKNSDTLSVESVTVEENAPLALMQCGLEGQLSGLRRTKAQIIKLQKGGD